jgi:hypothetical protein
VVVVVVAVEDERRVDDSTEMLNRGGKGGFIDEGWNYCEIGFIMTF